MSVFKPEPVERRLGDAVYDRLLALLGSEGFEQHARLPGEHALAERFAVSRPILRQALARLRAEGKLVTRKGSGTFVGDLQATPPVVAFGALTSIPDIRSFLDFRCSLEGEIAARAAQRRHPDAMVEIERRRGQFEAALRRGADGVEEDIAFHAAIAQACGNRFFAMTLQALTAQTRFSINLVRGLAGDRPPAVRHADVCAEHGAIVRAIFNGDAAAARQAMVAHLQGGIARLFGH